MELQRTRRRQPGRTLRDHSELPHETRHCAVGHEGPVPEGLLQVAVEGVHDPDGSP